MLREFRGGLPVRIVVFIGGGLGHFAERSVFGLDRGLALLQQIHILPGGQRDQFPGELCGGFGARILRSDFSRHALLKRPELGHERLLDGLFGGQAGGAGRPLLPEFGDFGRNHELACGDQPVEFEMKRGRLVDFRLAGTAARFGFGGGIVRGLDRSSKPFVQNLRIFRRDFGQIVPCSFQRSEFRRIIFHRRGRQLFEFAAYLFAPVQMLAEFA